VAIFAVAAGVSVTLRNSVAPSGGLCEVVASGGGSGYNSSFGHCWVPINAFSKATVLISRSRPHEILDGRAAVHSARVDG